MIAVTAVTDPARHRVLQRRLLGWFQGCGRDLAWRRTRDPYAILVSEVMLQQTQVARVTSAFTTFLRRFPTVSALAAAPAADVVTAWRGLGYNRRAVGLQRAARVIVAEHGGRVPGDLAALRALPGVGDYTARAVLAFAFDDDAAPVDTNVARVLARAVAGSPLRRRQAQDLADELVPTGRGRDWSGALMDLGAAHCTARAPRCRTCPLAAVCAWRQAGPAPDPAAACGLRARPQGAFADSDRYHRGRLVDALRAGPVPSASVPTAAGLQDADRAGTLAARLVADGLAQWHGGHLRLPA